MYISFSRTKTVCFNQDKELVFIQRFPLEEKILYLRPKSLTASKAKSKTFIKKRNNTLAISGTVLRMFRNARRICKNVETALDVAVKTKKGRN